MARALGGMTAAASWTDHGRGPVSETKRMIFEECHRIREIIARRAATPHNKNQT